MTFAACGGERAAAPAPATASGGSALVSLSRVPMRVEPKATAAVVALLPRGAEVRLDAAEGAFTRVEAKGGRVGWLEAGTYETTAEQQARERRTKSVSDFATIPGRIVTACPVYLAPDYGAARWGELEEGDPVEVVLAEHDFLGVRLLGIPLAFVPSHAVRYAAPPPTAPEVPFPLAATGPASAGGGAGAVGAPAAEAPAKAGEGPVPVAPAALEPYAALPFGAEPPVLRTRVEPQYPAAARRAGVGGEVVLQVVVERDGTIGGVFATQEAPMGLTAAATDAVRGWVYTPARLDGHPIAVIKTVRVRFSPAASATP